MSAYSYLHHRMFVAALGNDATSAYPESPGEGWSLGSASWPEVASHAATQAPERKLPGVLLANALLTGYRPAAS